eukprot:gene32739-33880_t
MSYVVSLDRGLLLACACGPDFRKSHDDLPSSDLLKSASSRPSNLRIQQPGQSSLTAVKARVQSARALRVITHASAQGQDRAVFQALPQLDITLYDIQDCFEATRDLRPSDRRDYFVSHGIDYDNVLNYYDSVKTLEHTFDKGRHGTDGVLLDSVMQGAMAFAASLGFDFLLHK